MQSAKSKAKTNQCKLPIETQHMLQAECKRRKLMPDDVVAILDSALVAGAIIKDAAADRRLKALAIARRLHYCIAK
jgi:hypothetical protein